MLDIEHNRISRNSTLGDVLKHVGTVELQSLYDTYLQPVLAKHPDVAARIPGSMEKQRAQDMRAALLAVLEAPSCLAEMFNMLPSTARRVLGMTAWALDMPASELERVVKKPLDIALSYNQMRRLLIVAPPEYALLGVRVLPGVCPWNAPPPKSVPANKYHVSMFPCIAEMFRPVLPKPEHYALKSGVKPAAHLHRFTNEPHALSDLRMANDWLESGTAKVNLNGKVASTALVKLGTMLGGPDFFPKVKGVQSALKAALLVEMLRTSHRQKSDVPILDRMGRSLLDAFQSSRFSVLPAFCPHVRTRWGRLDPGIERNIKPALVSLLRALPPGQWVSLDDVGRHVKVRGYDIRPVEDYCGLHTDDNRVFDQQAFMFSTATYADPRDVVELPIVKGMFFLAAACGWMELAYRTPTERVARHVHHLSWGTGGMKADTGNGDTPYLCLEHARLTELGAYVLGVTDGYVAQVVETGATITLDDTRLVATVKGNDAVKRVILEGMMERVSASCYVMTFESLLHGCREAEMIKQRIARFRTHVCAKPPEVWESMFARALTRATPVEAVDDYAVYTVPDDPELVRLIATDPELRRIVRRAEGRLILVRHTDTRMLRKHLESHGFIAI